VVSYVFCAIKALTSLHKTEVKPLRSHGLFNDVFTNFLGSGSCLDCQCRDRKLSEFIKKNLLLCSKDQRKSHRFGTTWRWL